MNIKWSPDEYRAACPLARDVGEEMLARLDWMTLKPRVIVDLGCGTGELTKELQKRYADALVIALDSSWDMVNSAASLPCVFADAGTLPFKDQSVDLLFANFLLPWCADIETILLEFRRVLRPLGLLMFTALGPDTLKEFSRNVAAGFVDMHDVGDLLLKQKFSDPVLDVNYYTMSYRKQSSLFSELKATGMLTASADITADEISCTEEGKWEVTFEVIFAHAFSPAASDEVSASEDGIVRVPLSHLRRNLNM